MPRLQQQQLQLASIWRWQPSCIPNPFMQRALAQAWPALAALLAFSLTLTNIFVRFNPISW